MKATTATAADGDLLALVDDLARLFARLYREGKLDAGENSSDSLTTCQKFSPSHNPR
jgi:hypothetical protein